MKKKIVLAIMALVVTMIVCNTKAYAGDVSPTVEPSPTPTPIVKNYNVLDTNVTNVDLNSAYYYYQNVLSSDQKQVAMYLVGSYNYMYLRSRGFNYSDINDTSDYVTHIIDFGIYFFTDGFKNASRYNSSFQKYIVAIINYAGTINVNFDTWLELYTDEFYIPYSIEGLNAWTQFYNDPSTEGLLNFGHEEGVWVSGAFYDFAFNDIGWDNSNVESNYNSFILNNSPVIFSNVVEYQANGQTYNRQRVVSMKDIPVYNTLFIQRSSGVPHNFRFGIYNNGLVQYTGTTPMFYVDKSSSLNGLYGYQDNARYNNNINTYNENTNIAELIDYAFFRTPFFFSTNVGGVEYFWSDFYPYIEHVYLVDDLNTLSNIEEVVNETDLGVQGDGKWIQTPNGQILLFPSKGNRVWELDPKDFLKKDDPNQSDPVPIDPDNDLKQQIVNNTVINNYEIIAPGAIINVPVNWLEGEGNYLEHTNNTALPFFVMVGDIFTALGEIRIFLIAVLILGLAAGVVVKFLL